MDWPFFCLDRKRTKWSPELASLQGFGNFCVQTKAKKGSGCPQITAQSWVWLSPLFDWGAVFGKCLNFFCEQFILWICLLVQNISFGSFDKILCKTVLLGNSLQTNFRFWHLIVWLDKFKLKEGPENCYSGSFETDGFWLKSLYKCYFWVVLGNIGFLINLTLQMILQIKY